MYYILLEVLDYIKYVLFFLHYDFFFPIEFFPSKVLTKHISYIEWTSKEEYYKYYKICVT